MEPALSLDQRLEDVSRLPTGFFPPPVSPILREASTSSTAAHPKHPRRVIVIAYDHSNFGDAVIAKCVRLGLINPSDDIRLLNVVSRSDYRNLFAPMLSANGTSGGIQDSEIDAHLTGAADAMIYEIINVLRKIGFSHVSSEIMRGDPKQAIVDYCRLAKPVYLITGSRGLGAVKRTMIGSVSNYLTLHCPCPVLVCKLDAAEIEARKELDAQKKATFAEVLKKFEH